MANILMYHYFILKNQSTNWFQELSKASTFEQISKNRKCANVCNVRSKFIPIIRTTVSYQHPNQRMKSIHHKLINEIKQAADEHLIEKVNFNNAIIEICDKALLSIGGVDMHQSQDFEEETMICIFSCYDNPHNQSCRELAICQKNTNAFHSHIILEHNSVVMFSVKTSSKHHHRILSKHEKVSTDIWLGVTLRNSKTFISFDNHDHQPRFLKNKHLLTLATENQRQEFQKLFWLDNDRVSHKYPELDYTMSIGDLSIENDNNNETDLSDCLADLYIE